MSKAYKLLLKVFETPADVAKTLGIKVNAVYQWKCNGVPRKFRQSLFDAANGKIKSVEKLRDKKKVKELAS